MLFCPIRNFREVVASFGSFFLFPSVFLIFCLKILDTFPDLGPELENIDYWY
jgi:hypothetical protein